MLSPDQGRALSRGGDGVSFPEQGRSPACKTIDDDPTGLLLCRCLGGPLPAREMLRSKISLASTTQIIMPSILLEHLMTLVFYERVGHEGRRPSPYSWRIRYALAHKGVSFEVRPVRFADVDVIRGITGQHLTPVLSDGRRAVHETWDIACYLEDR